MGQHVVSMIFQNNIDELNNFMKFYIMMDVILIVFNDLDLIVVSMIIIHILVKFPSKCTINDQILTNNKERNTSQKRDDQKCLDQLGESVIINNTSEMIGARFGNSKKQLIISFFITAHSAHGNNLNDNYFYFCNDPFANYYINASMFSELVFSAEIDTTVHWNAISSMLEQLPTDTMKTEVEFPNLPGICEPGNAAIMKEYHAEKVYDYLYNTPLANCYYCYKVKDDFEATLTQTLFAKHGITLHREPRVACLENTNAVYDTIFGNTANHVAENKTKSGHYDGFDRDVLLDSEKLF